MPTGPRRAIALLCSETRATLVLRHLCNAASRHLEPVKLIVLRCTESESGGRIDKVILTNTILPETSREFLACMMEGTRLQR